jgi:hypothetical protein
MLGAINYTPHQRAAATLSMRYYFRPRNPQCLFTFLTLSFPDLPASAEIWDESQPCVTGTFQCPGPRNRKIGTHEGSLPISKSGDRRPSAVDDFRAEIPTANRTTILFIRKDSMSFVISSESGEDVKPESASAENSPRSAHFSFSTSTPAATRMPYPSAFEVTASEGAICPGHPVTVMLLTSNATTQSPQLWRMRRSGCTTRWNT